MSTSTSTQIPDQKASKKTDISREQHSKQANIRQEKLRKVKQNIKVCQPGFHNFRYIIILRGRISVARILKC